MATEQPKQPQTVVFRFDQQPCRWMLAGLAMHALMYRATFSDEKRPALSIAAEAVRQADAMIEVLSQER